MSKIYNSGRIGWVLMGFFFLLSFNSAYASVIINEIMYAPAGAQSGREWLEIKNVSGGSIDFSEKIGSAFRYRFIKINSDSESPISPFDSDKFTLQSGELAVVASDGNKFLTDYPNFSGLLLKSSFGSLNDQGDKIIIHDKSSNQDFDSVIYSPDQNGNKDGNSLQLINGSWQAATPTPGQANQSSSSSSNSDTGSSNTTTTEENSTTIIETKPKTTISPTMKAKIVANSLVFTGQPFAMKADISGFSNENVLLGRVYWNFGDGISLEQVNNFEKFYHLYHYPGDYVVLVEYYRNNFSETPDATAKMIIKVVPTAVTISKVGDANDFFIELSNQASSDIDVSNWVLNANGKTFSLPKNSVIISKKQMIISGKVTGFIYGDQFNLKLFSSTGEMVFDYAPPPTRQFTPPLPNPPQRGGSSPSPLGRELEGGVENQVEMSEVEEVNPENLGATVIESDIAKNNPIRTYFLTTVFTVFLGVSTGAVYFIRQKRNPPKVGDDFKILDE